MPDNIWKNKQLFTTVNINIHSKTVRPLNFPWRHLLLLLHFCFCLRSKVCHLNAMASSGGVMDEIIDRRNKAVTFIALSDLLRHRPNKQKAKLIVPDHIGAVTPAPDPAFVSRTLGCHLWSHCSPPFTTKNKQLKGRDRSYPWALNMGIRSVGWPIKWFPIEGSGPPSQRSGGLMNPTWRGCYSTSKPKSHHCVHRADMVPDGDHQPQDFGCPRKKENWQNMCVWIFTEGAQVLPWCHIPDSVSQLPPKNVCVGRLN